MEIVKEYGWVGFTVLWILNTLYPDMFKFLRKRSEDKRLAEIEAIKAKQNEEFEEARAERDERKAERQFRHDIDERNAKSQEKLVEVVQAMSAVMVRLDEKVTIVQASQSAMGEMMTTAIMQMNSAVSRFHPDHKPKRSTRSKTKK